MSTTQRRRQRVRYAWRVLRGTDDSLSGLWRSESERFLQEAADSNEMLVRLAEACWHVPLKTARNAKEQAAVEVFTSAVVDARTRLRLRGFLR